jgi:hypothetical protein
MKEDTDKFVGEWQNEAGNLLVIEKKTDQRCSVTFLKGPNSEPVLRPYFRNLPSIEMDSIIIDHGSILEVELWEKEKGFSLHLTYENAYELDTDFRASLVPALSRYSEDEFLDQYYYLFYPLKHYVRKHSR